MADLCSKLHTKTNIEHGRSDKLINLKLLVVATDKALWSKAIANFYFIFKTLEDELLQFKDHKRLWCLYIPELLRAAAFEEDLRYFFGEEWSSAVSPSPATYIVDPQTKAGFYNLVLDGRVVELAAKRKLKPVFHSGISHAVGKMFCSEKVILSPVSNGSYCAVSPSVTNSLPRAAPDILHLYIHQGPVVRKENFMKHIHDVAEENPILLVAYCHSFYLGMMAGGQIIKTMITKSLGLKDGRGTAAFQFTQKSAAQMKKQLKDSINGLGVNDEIENKLIQEKILAYKMTNAIVSEIKLQPSSFAGILKLFLLLLICPLVLAYVVYLCGQIEPASLTF